MKLIIDNIELATVSSKFDADFSIFFTFFFFNSEFDFD